MPPTPPPPRGRRPSSLPRPPPPQNPFGEAKPREAVLSTRLGKSEQEILKEEITKERPKVRASIRWAQWAGASRPPTPLHGGGAAAAAALERQGAACAARDAALLVRVSSAAHAPAPAAPRPYPHSHPARPSAHPPSPLQLRLNPQQLDEKKAAEAAISEVAVRSAPSPHLTLTPTLQYRSPCPRPSTPLHLATHAACSRAGSRLLSMPRPLWQRPCAPSPSTHSSSPSGAVHPADLPAPRFALPPAPCRHPAFTLPPPRRHPAPPQELVDAEPDAVKKSELQEELTARKAALDKLMDEFEVRGAVWGVGVV
jgi:hypothetical protein